MVLHSSLFEPAPRRRAANRKLGKLESSQEFREMQQRVLSGELRVGQALWWYMNEATAPRKLDISRPWMQARDLINTWLEEQGLEKQYRAGQLLHPDRPGVRVVRLQRLAAAPAVQQPQQAVVARARRR